MTRRVSAAHGRHRPRPRAHTTTGTDVFAATMVPDVPARPAPSPGDGEEITGRLRRDKRSMNTTAIR